jgi:HD superfamily phosphodiesterase
MLVAQVLSKMIEYFGKDARRINHALKVHSFSALIARNENLSSELQEITEVAAILHDIGIPVSEQKYGSCIGKYQEIEGPPIARELLKQLGAASELIERVCFLIGNHHTYTKIDDIDFQILVEADFLVNIFEDDMSSSAIESARDKYFKTKAGTNLIESMYLMKNRI